MSARCWPDTIAFHASLAAAAVDAGEAGVAKYHATLAAHSARALAREERFARWIARGYAVAIAFVLAGLIAPALGLRFGWTVAVAGTTAFLLAGRLGGARS